MRKSRSPLEVVRFLRSDGLAVTSRYVRNGLTTRLGLRTARTFFYQFNPEKWNSQRAEVPDGVAISRITAREEAAAFAQSERLTRLPMEKMFSQDALCFVLHRNQTLLGFSWIQRQSFGMSARHEFRLNGDDRRLGPTFVHRVERGRGWNKLLIRWRLNYLMEAGILHVFSSTSAENAASIRCLVSSGMEVIGQTSVRRIGSRIIRFGVIDFTPDSSFRQRIGQRHG